MLRALGSLLLLASLLAHAQRGRPAGPPEPLPELRYENGGSHGPDGNASGRGVLLKPYCFKQPEFCAVPGMTLSLWTQYGRLVALQEIEAPEPFTLLGVRFAAKNPVQLVGGGALPLLRGTLAAPLEVDGRLVQGRVEVTFRAAKEPHVQVGTLAREAVIEGWKAPAGTTFDLQNLASGSWVLTAPAGNAVMWAGEPRTGVPARASAVTQWRDAQGVTNLRLELTGPETLDGLTFGPGTVTFLRRDEATGLQGVVSAAFVRGAIKAPAGTYVALCGGVVQTVKAEDAVVRIGRFVTTKLDAVRERSPRGWRNEFDGPKVLDACAEGAPLGYTFLPQYCPTCTGAEKVPSLVVVDLQGEPRDDESRAMLDTFPSLKKASCPPCR